MSLSTIVTVTNRSMLATFSWLTYSKIRCVDPITEKLIP